MNPTPSTCRNCGGTERYAKEVNATGGYGPDLLPLGLFTRGKFRIDVCGACGHVEWFVPARFLGRLKDHFDRIPEPPLP